MLGPLTYLDAAVVAIALLSGLLAMYRGLTREVLSILSWIAAAGAVLYFVLYHKPAAEQLAAQFHAPPAVAQVVAGGLIFLIVLIIVHLITARISDTILDSRVGIIDRILGFVFGVVRGFVLVVIPYMFTVSFMCKDGAARGLSQGCKPGELPGWVENAQSLPIISQTSGTLFSILSRYVPSATGEQLQGHLMPNDNNSIVAPSSHRASLALYPARPAGTNA
jgi:membrane protein required for colicin V production